VDDVPEIDWTLSYLRGDGSLVYDTRNLIVTQATGPQLTFVPDQPLGGAICTLTASLASDPAISCSYQFPLIDVWSKPVCAAAQPLEPGGTYEIAWNTYVYGGASLTPQSLAEYPSWLQNVSRWQGLEVEAQSAGTRIINDTQLVVASDEPVGVIVIRGVTGEGVDAVLYDVPLEVKPQQPEPTTGAPGSGDFDGDNRVTMTEVITTLNVVIGRGIFTPAQKASVDMDGDGVVTMTDVIKVLRRSIGLDMPS
jgi:hypothetical protein